MMPHGIDAALERAWKPLDLGVENAVHRKIAESPGVAELNKNKALDDPFGVIGFRVEQPALWRRRSPGAAGID
jgi:hypothetical protein